MDLAVNSMLKAHSENVMPASALLPSQFGLPELKSMEWYAHELAPRVKVISVEICVEGEEGEGGEGGGQGEGGKDPTPGEGGGSKPNGKIKITVSSGDKKLDSLLNEPHDLDAEKAKIPGQNLSDTLDTIERNVDTTAQEVADLLDKLDRGKGCGSVPGFVRERLDRLKMVSPVKWEQILLSMIMDAKNRSAEFKINALNYGRVTMGSELGMFGVDQDILMFRIFCGIDTSGSMGSEQLTYIVSVIQAFVKMETDIEVKVVKYDCAIHKRYILKRNGQVDVNVIGRGGTDFNPFYREAKLGTDPLGKRFEPDLVLNFTDGYAPPPTEEYRKLKVPDAWILTKHGAHPCPKPGRTIRLDF
jgi:predicted metal-dependent peptidase